MSYATVHDVEAYLTARAPFTANTKPTATQVAFFVEAAAADLNADMSLAGYGLPVASTATMALAQLRDACAVCAAERVERAAPTSDRIDHFAEMCATARKMLADGQLIGVDTSASDNIARYEPQGASPMFWREMEL